MSKIIPTTPGPQAPSIADGFKQSIVKVAQVNLINFDGDDAEYVPCIFVLFSDDSQIHFSVGDVGTINAKQRSK